MSKKRLHGFTLIELLVVVAIIALLIAILLPSLGKAKERAKLTACASNLHSIGEGCVTYATEWNNFLPPMADALSYSPPNTYQANNGGIVGLGQLYQNGSIKDPRVFFCPSEQSNQLAIQSNFVYNDAAARAAPGGWISLDDTTQRLGYQYQIHGAPSSPGSSTYVVQYPRTIDYTPYAVMAVDLMWGQNYCAHGNPASPGSTTYNSVFVDGHVQGVNGGVVRPVQKNPDGISIHTAAGSFVSEMVNAPSTFATTAGGMANDVWDLDYAAQTK